MTDFFKAMAIDKWYKAIFYTGVVVFITSLCIETKGVSNSQLQTLSAGAILFSIGVWKDQTTKSKFKPPNAYTGPAMLLTWHVWEPSLIGLIFNLLGIINFVLGIRSIYLTWN